MASRKGTGGGKSRGGGQRSPPAPSIRGARSVAEIERVTRAVVSAASSRFILADPKARRYLDRTTGEIISRYEQVRRSSGGLTPRQKATENLLRMARERTTAEGREKIGAVLDTRGRQKAFTQAFKEKKARELGVRPRDIKVRGDSDTAQEFKLANALQKDLRERVRNGRGSKADVRRYVRALVALGVIDEDDAATWRDQYTSRV